MGKRLNRYFTHKGIQMTNKYMKKCMNHQYSSEKFKVKSLTYHSSMAETNTTLKSNLPPSKKFIKKEKDITLPLPEWLKRQCQVFGGIRKNWNSHTLPVGL